MLATVAQPAPVLIGPAGGTVGSSTVFFSAMAAAPRAKPGESDLTNLGWLQKPGVLTSMCTALTGSPHRVSKAGTRATRKLRGPRELSCLKGEARRASTGGAKDSDKMVNVILNVRNRKYNGEDAHKPPLSFACMIFMAIESSPMKTLPVKEIYEWIMWKFPYYRTAAPGWKNSVRHNLSLNKCFRKVDRGSSKSKSPLTKGGLWTVDPDYRRSLVAALKRSPYHPYHSYFTPPLSPSSSTCSLESLDPAERDAALTMCMIGGGPDHATLVTPGILHAIQHDHCYSKRPLLPPMPPARKGLSLAEVAAAAEMILQQDQAREQESSDEGLGGEVESEGEEEEEEEDDDDDEEEEEDDEDMECGGTRGDYSLADSGFGETGTLTPPVDPSCSSMEELGADALLCLAGKRS